MLENGPKIILLILSFSSIFFFPSCAKMEYDVTANVGSSSWSIHRSTQVFKCYLDSSVEGVGGFSKLVHVKEMVGIEANELSSSYPGSMAYEEIMFIQTGEGPVYFTATMRERVNESTNASKIETNESAILFIDENWPAYLANYKNITYFGPGIRVREFYNNNGDAISSSVDSWLLFKESVYQSNIDRCIFHVNITPNSVSEVKKANKKSHYNLDLQSIGQYVYLDLIRQKSLEKDPIIHIAESYSGNQSINLKINMNESVLIPENEDYWLKCCNINNIHSKI